MLKRGLQQLCVCVGGGSPTARAGQGQAGWVIRQAGSCLPCAVVPCTLGCAVRVTGMFGKVSKQADTFTCTYMIPSVAARWCHECEMHLQRALTMYQPCISGSSGVVGHRSVSVYVVGDMHACVCRSSQAGLVLPLYNKGCIVNKAVRLPML